MRVSDYRYKGRLLALESGVDEYDRPIEGWNPIRDMFFSELGVTATEKALFAQNKTDVSRKIGIRYDPLLLDNATGYRVGIGEDSYVILRVYTDMQNERMELSLSYVN